MMNNLEEIKFKDGKRHQAGMTVPENFFVEFQMNLEKELDKMEAQKTAVVEVKTEQLSINPSYRRNIVMRWASIAACACLLVVAGFYAMNLSTDLSDEGAASEMVAGNAMENEFSEDDQLILSSFDDLYLYDLYCESGY